MDSASIAMTSLEQEGSCEPGGARESSRIRPASSAARSSRGQYGQYVVPPWFEEEFGTEGGPEAARGSICQVQPGRDPGELNLGICEA